MSSYNIRRYYTNLIPRSVKNVIIKDSYGNNNYVSNYIKSKQMNEQKYYNIRNHSQDGKHYQNDNIILKNYSNKVSREFEGNPQIESFSNSNQCYQNNIQVRSKAHKRNNSFTMINDVHDNGICFCV